MTDLFTTTPEDTQENATRRLPRKDNRALVDIAPGERDAALSKWTMRNAIIRAREDIKEAKRLKRKLKRDRKAFCTKFGIDPSKI